MNSNSNNNCTINNIIINNNSTKNKVLNHRKENIVNADNNMNNQNNMIWNQSTSKPKWGWRIADQTMT